MAGSYKYTVGVTVGVTVGTWDRSFSFAGNVAYDVNTRIFGVFGVCCVLSFRAFSSSITEGDVASMCVESATVCSQ